MIHSDTYAQLRDKTGNTLVKCETNGICNVITSTESNTHYLDTKTDTVITCASNINTCTLEDPSIKGYFKNSDSIDTAHKIIECTASKTSPCSVIEGESGDVCTDKIGKVLKSSLKLCISNDINDAVAISTSGTSLYKTIRIKQNNDFPGTNAGTISVKIGNDGSVILLEDTGLPSCTSITTDDACLTNAINGQYCIHSDNKIYKTTISGGTKSCSLLNGKSDIVPIYFNNVYEIVDTPTKTSNYIISYKCEFNNDDQHTVKSCEIIKGYVIDSTNYIHCTGWKRDGCQVRTINSSKSSCTKGIGEFQINSSNNKLICFGSNEFTIPNSVSTDYIAFKSSNINPIYNIISEKIVFVKVIKGTSFTYVLETKETGKIF